MPAVGEMAPDFELQADDGSVVRLSDYRGKRIIIYFYPKDNTSGCTAQACLFRDQEPEFAEKNAVILGISPDSIKSHQGFRLKHNLPFRLLSDPEHQVAESYGAWGEKSMYGKKYLGIIRSHFVIDEEGKIIQAQTKVSPAESAPLALAALG